MRWIAAGLAALALIVLGTDLVAALLGGGTFRLSALGEWWVWIDTTSLQLLQAAVQRHLAPELWDHGIQPLLEWPLAVELAVLAVLFWAMGRRRRRADRRIED